MYKQVSKIILILILFNTVTVLSQTVKGKVWGNTSSEKQPLEGVTVKWDKTEKGTLTNSDGTFELNADGISNRKLNFHFIGYGHTIVDVGDKNFVEITLNQDSIKTETIEVEDQRKSTYIENKEIKREVITAQELVKDACCDLSGCFGRNSSVDVAVTDIVTDSKELKILGLEGVYTQLLVDNMPILTGLNTKYGVSGIPGTLIDKITISKGSNSVLQGYESISGIINVLLKDHDNSENRIFLNGFMNSMLEKQFNANFSKPFGKKWNTILSLHSTQEGKHIDDNNDHFIDYPLVTRYMAFNKWRYGTYEDETQFMFGAKYLNEKRIGGHKGYDPDIHKGSNTIYGQTVDMNSGDLYARYSHSFENMNEIKFLASANYYDMKSYYGVTRYDGRQFTMNISGLYEFELAPSNFLKAGISYKQEKINENISFNSPVNKTYAGEYEKFESIPGVFAEHSVDFADKKLSILSGIRFDYHNQHKLVITPRVLIRTQPVEQTVIRASFGTGFRTINLFNEYSTLLASGRDIQIAEEFRPEKMINYGIDILQYFNFNKLSGSINVDFYRTDFSNKIIPDYETDPNKAIFANLNGKAYSNIFQAELNMNLFYNFDVKLGYKYLDNKYTLNGVLTEQPFVSKERVTSTFSYIPDNKSWGASIGLQWFGKQRLPSTASNPEEYRREDESKPYTLMNVQLNKNFKYFEIYAGMENALNFKQENPIISADEPFGKYFDTSFIWGPTKGREIYAGFRLKLN